MDEVLDFGVQGASSARWPCSSAVLGQLSLQAFVFSDQHKSVSLGWFDTTVKELAFEPTPVEDLDKPRTGLLPPGTSHLFRRDNLNANDENSATAMLLGLGPWQDTTLRLRASALRDRADEQARRS